jgi:hypothetical protein
MPWGKKMRTTFLALVACSVLPVAASADHEMQIIFDEAQYVLTCVSPADLSYIMKGAEEGIETVRSRLNTKLNEVIQGNVRACGYITNQTGEYLPVQGLRVQLVQELGATRNGSGEVSLDLFRITTLSGMSLYMVIASPIVDGQHQPGYDLITRNFGFNPSQ